MMMEATTGEPQKLGGMATATEKPQRKLELIREVMQNEWQADAVLFRINNAFDNSDSSDIEAISGFSGSNGTAIVSKTEALLAVDGRYTAQAAQQVNSSVWEVVRYPDYNIIKMIKKIVKPGEELVISASAHSYNSYISILKQAESMDVRVKVIDQYPIDRVLQENSLVIDENYTGDSVNSLCEKQLEKEGVLITDKETVSCLFGIRKKELGADKGPVPRAIAFIPNGESPIVFCDLKAEFDNYKVASIKDFAKEMGKFSGYRVKIDYATCPASFVNTVLELDCKVINCASDYDKIKTSAEMEDQKLGAHKTGESFIRMLAHVDHIVETGAQLT
ncbi:MAG: aminopeptidase P family N-terminal domain-containing protein, partial [Holosporales bacterium]|nr:aminopeptidase P family N-terminal domain-containing protein [Holosporales bacterium]